MNKNDSAPFAPDRADADDYIISVIRVGTEEEHSDHHTDADGINHETCCWAVATAMEKRRHRRVDLLKKDMDAMTSWLVRSDVAMTVAVFDPASPWGLLVRYRHDSEAPQFVWWQDRLYERNRHSGQLTYVCEAPLRWTPEELGL